MYQRINFNIISANTSTYENISTKKDPMFDKVISAINVVKAFIVKKGLIIYGGTAIDFALRLHGDKIYSDENLLFPDLDFYSPDNVNDAYELADQLFEAGFEEARVIVATYVRTMRVDIGDNHFIADITYMPPSVFAEFDYLEYEGMRMVNPEYQKLDLHSSLSYPYDNSPREVIFHRWAKDIKRYNLLDKYYPTKPGPDFKLPKIAQISIKTGPWTTRAVIGGWLGYAAICTQYKKLAALLAAQEVKMPENVPTFVDLELIVEPGELRFGAPTPTLHLFTFDCPAAIEGLPETYKGAEVVRRAALTNIVNESTTLKPKGATPTVTVFDIHEHLISCNVQDSPAGVLRTDSAQGLLRHFLALSMFEEGSPDLYLFFYVELQKMIRAAELLMKALSDRAKKPELSTLFLELERRSPFHPSVSFFGHGNHSENYEFSLVRLESAINKSQMPPEYKIPMGYHPHKKAPKPTFDYEGSKFFIKDGRVLPR